MKTLNARLRLLQKRLGRREELIAGIVLVVLAVGGFAFTAVTQIGTPAGAALAYMAAVNRADTDYVWSHSIIESAKTSSTDVSLVDRSSLAAQLAASAHTRSQLSVQDVGYANGATKVTLTYNTSTGRRSISLVMQGGAPHSWPVVIEPAGLDFRLPSGAGSLAIDGEKIDAKARSETKAAVFPGLHKVSLEASHLFNAFTADVDAERSLPALTSVSLNGMTLTNDATTEAKAAVSNVIKSCVAATTLRPAGCPQAYTTDLAYGDATWTLLGDPVAVASAGVGGDGQLQVAGHYLMRLRFASNTTHATHVIAAGGPYLAALKWDGEAISVSTFADASHISALARPDATDAAVLAALKPQFDSCLKLQAGSAPQCPQEDPALYASNFVWHANADPTQGTTVAWDGAQGFFRVSGSYDFTVDYDSTPPYSGTRHYQDHVAGKYVADLYWDGAKVVFVGFEG
jgi:hypothetical protein